MGSKRSLEVPCGCDDVGYYDDGVNIQCQQCDESCQECGKDLCTKCVTNKVVDINNKFLCKCEFDDIDD